MLSDEERQAIEQMLGRLELRTGWDRLAKPVIRIIRRLLEEVEDDT